MNGRDAAPGARRESSPSTSQTRSISSEPTSLLVSRCSRLLNSMQPSLADDTRSTSVYSYGSLNCQGEVLGPEQLAPIVLGRVQGTSSSSRERQMCTRRLQR